MSTHLGNSIFFLLPYAIWFKELSFKKIGSPVSGGMTLRASQKFLATDYTDECTAKTFFTTKDTKYTKEFSKVQLNILKPDLLKNLSALRVLRGEMVFLQGSHGFSLILLDNPRKFVKSVARVLKTPVRNGKVKICIRSR